MSRSKLKLSLPHWEIAFLKEGLNCPRFTAGIPVNTSVPGWAYENTTSSTFNVQAALADHCKHLIIHHNPVLILRYTKLLNRLRRQAQAHFCP